MRVATKYLSSLNEACSSFQFAQVNWSLGWNVRRFAGQEKVYRLMLWLLNLYDRILIELDCYIDERFVSKRVERKCIEISTASQDTKNVWTPSNIQSTKYHELPTTRYMLRTHRLCTASFFRDAMIISQSAKPSPFISKCDLKASGHYISWLS